MLSSAQALAFYIRVKVGHRLFLIVWVWDREQWELAVPLVFQPNVAVEHIHSMNIRTHAQLLHMANLAVDSVLTIHDILLSFLAEQITMSLNNSSCLWRYVGMPLFRVFCKKMKCIDWKNIPRVCVICSPAMWHCLVWVKLAAFLST